MAGALLATTLAVSAPATAGRLQACDVDSDFHLQVNDRAIVFHRDSGAPKRVEMRGGALLVDGARQALSAADARRVADIEDKVRAMLPEVLDIATEAVDIAHGAVLQVARALAGDDDARVAGMARELDAARERAVSSIGTPEFDTARLEDQIEGLVEDLVPMLVGDVTAIAISAALSGDEHKVRELERRIERMEAQIEAEVEQRAEALEARAEALCPRIAELDAIEDSLDYRLADNRPLNLFEAEAH